MADIDQEMLSIYLNDHFGGSVVGVELARRTASAHRGTESGPDLERIAGEIAEDREALKDIMAALDIPIRQYKAIGGWVVEKAGRLKPNGRLLTRSPLSNLVELEGLLLGVEGKGAGWRALRALAEHDSRLDTTQLDTLIARARSQADTLEQLRMRAAAEAFGLG